MRWGAGITCVNHAPGRAVVRHSRELHPKMGRPSVCSDARRAKHSENSIARLAGRWHGRGVALVEWQRELAEVYDETYAAMFEPAVLDPMVDLLLDLAEGGPVLEFAVGTGRVALPLASRGVPVQGLELSQQMADVLGRKPGADAVQVTVGDMCSMQIPGEFTLVYVVANGLMNVTTQEEQVAVFGNASAHLRPGGRFVVELVVPQLQHVPPGETARVFTLEQDHVGIETFDDLVAQVAWSHHWMYSKGGLVRHSAPYRYVWPAELVLMAQLAGFHLQSRGDWHREPFTSASVSQVAVFEKTP